MGFLKDFENELKIFFVLVALVILAGWFGTLSSLSLSREEIKETETPVVVVEEEEIEEEQKVEIETRMYVNETLGISLEYPAGWFVYDESARQQDNEVALCQEEGVIENTFILSKEDLGRCVGVREFNAWPGDMLVSFSEKEWEGFPVVLDGEEGVLVDIDGIQAVRYIFNENSLDSRKQAVRSYVNVNGRGYIIEFTQEDLLGSYDAAFDEILASLKWL